MTGVSLYYTLIFDQLSFFINFLQQVQQYLSSGENIINQKMKLRRI